MSENHSGKPHICTIPGLRRHLQIAMEIEHFTIPPYLCALYSIKDGTNREARDVIQTVVMEEMLHMVLVANLLRAVGGESQVNNPRYVPTYPSPLPHFPDSFKINLRKFSPLALDTFIRIEEPEQDTFPELKSCAEDDDQVFDTIGQFYDAVKKGLVWLCNEKYDEKTVFSGRDKRQVTREHYYGGAGHLFTIHGLNDAMHAIDLIVEQGEGLPEEVFKKGPGERRAQKYNLDRPEDHPIYRADTSSHLHVGFDNRIEPAHYFRFKEIREGRYYQAGDDMDKDPPDPPSGPEFPVQWDGAWNMQVNPKAANYAPGSPIRVKMDACNHSYSRLLDHLQDAFNGNPDSFIDAVGDMFEIKHRGTELMRVPNELPTLEGTTVGTSFEYIPPEDR